MTAQLLDKLFHLRIRKCVGYIFGENITELVYRENFLGAGVHYSVYPAETLAEKLGGASPYTAYSECEDKPVRLVLL